MNILQRDIAYLRNPLFARGFTKVAKCNFRENLLWKNTLLR
jgi:hypothetical protein